MNPELRQIGKSQSPLVIIDNFSGAVEEIGRIADDLAPFPPNHGNYPGVRRMISEADEKAYAYVLETCNRAAPFIGGGFGVDSFDLVEASFSVVTINPDELKPVQKAPHFDSPEQNIFALLHYLRVPEGSGTAFYRHRATGIERVTNDTVSFFANRARSDAARLAPDSGYMHGSDPFYERIASIEAVADRVIIYHGSLLHSGIIPPGMSLNADPREGRLTANFFLRGN